MNSPDNLACPTATQSEAPSGMVFKNKIEGGLTKRQEIASRVVQGLMGYAINDKGKSVDPRIIVNLGFVYADLILNDVAEVKLDPVPSSIIT